MEAEYIALSQSMRDLIPLRETIKEFQQHVLASNAHNLRTSTLSKAFHPIPQSIVFEDNDSCLRLASLGKMSPRTKHIAIPYHFFHSKIEDWKSKLYPLILKNSWQINSPKVFRNLNLFNLENLYAVGNFTCSEESQDI